MPRDLCAAPRWATNAVATERGWEDPKTGELLVSIRNLVGIQEELGCGSPVVESVKDEPQAPPVKDVVDSDVVDDNDIVKNDEEPESDVVDPTDDGEKSDEDKLLELIRTLDVNEKNYTKGGKPDANILSDILDRDVSAKERDAAWKVIQDEKLTVDVDTPLADVKVTV